MVILVRLLRVALVTILCIVVFAALFEFLNAVPTYLFLPDHLEGGDAYGSSRMMFLGALWWGAVFRAPGYLFYGTVPLLIVMAATEWKSMKSWREYLAIWLIAGLLATGFPVSYPLRLAAVVIAAAGVSYFYWLLAGKSAGDRLQDWTPASNGALRLANYVAYAVVAYLAYQLTGYLFYAGKLLWTFVSEPGPGTPPFQVRFKRPLTASQKVALMDFPDLESCLKKAETDGLSIDRLKEMDWDRIDNKDEADVCMCSDCWVPIRICPTQPIGSKRRVSTSRTTSAALTLISSGMGRSALPPDIRYASMAQNIRQKASSGGHLDRFRMA